MNFFAPQHLLFCLFFCCTFLIAQEGDNPAMEGFNVAGSDAEAIAIADEVMQAMGGRSNWDNTRYVTWKFFGRRLHVWDKWSGNIRVEGKDFIVLMNLHSKKGRAIKNGAEVVHPDSLGKMLEYGEALWINDSYWMFMPYKLKDSGVTLKYLGEGETANGNPARMLELTFASVGKTPDNKYRVYVDAATSLVTQWDFFRDAADEAPGFSNPWDNWKTYGTILLSDGRGKSQHSDIQVFTTLPASVFENLETVTLPAIK